MDEQAAAGIATQMVQSVVAKAFEAMPPAEAERILARISFDRQAAILRPFNATAAAAILQQKADWPKFLGNAHNLAPSDLVRFLAAMPPDTSPSTKR